MILKKNSVKNGQVKSQNVSEKKHPEHKHFITFVIKAEAIRNLTNRETWNQFKSHQPMTWSCSGKSYTIIAIKLQLGTKLRLISNPG